MKEIIIGARISGGLLSLAAYRKDGEAYRLLKESQSAAHDLPDAAAPLAWFLKLWAGKRFRFVFHIPRSLIVSRFLELPSLKMEELRRMCAYQALAAIPFPEEDLVWDAVALDQDRGKGTSKVYLAVAQKIRLKPYFELFEKLGRSPDAFALSCFAHSAYLREEKGFKPENYLHAHAEDGWLELDLFRFGKLVSTRAVPFREAEDLSERLAEECARSVSTVDPDGRVSHWIVSGESGFTSPGALSSLEKFSRAEVQSIDPPGHLDWILSGCCRTPPYFLLDLSSSGQKAFREEKRRRREIRAAALWGALWVVSLACVLGASLARKKIEISRLDSEIRRLEPAAQRTSEILDSMAFLKEQMDFSTSPSEALREIHAIVPVGMALSSFFFDADGRLVLQGAADRYSDVMDWVRALESSALFSRAELKTSNSRKIRDKEKVDFQVQCTMGEKG